MELKYSREVTRKACLSFEDQSSISGGKLHVVVVQLCHPGGSNLPILALQIGAELSLAIAAVRMPCEAVSSVLNTPHSNDVECHAVMQSSLTRPCKSFKAVCFCRLSLHSYLPKDWSYC